MFSFGTLTFSLCWGRHCGKKVSLATLEERREDSSPSSSDDECALQAFYEEWGMVVDDRPQKQSAARMRQHYKKQRSAKRKDEAQRLKRQKLREKEVLEENKRFLLTDKDTTHVIEVGKAAPKEIGRKKLSSFLERHRLERVRVGRHYIVSRKA